MSNSDTALLGAPRVILVDPEQSSRELMTKRLRAQGYAVEATHDAAAGATSALAAPPDAVISDLWMPSISGVQLCRLLRSEPATADVPILLRGDVSDPRSRFWAEHAGAAAYVAKGRMGELTRALAAAVSNRPGERGFFMQLSESDQDIRDRIARQLDTALFESVIAGEVRSLGCHGSFEQLFDHLSQLVSQLVHYRWLAVSTGIPVRVGVHHHPDDAGAVEEEIRAALGVDAEPALHRITDEDACSEPMASPPVVLAISMGGTPLGKIALSPTEASAGTDTVALVQMIGRELAGPLRIVALVEEAERLATTDSLTGLLNRRAFVGGLGIELARSSRYELPLSVLLVDIDRFKAINDVHGHAVGDRALVAIAHAARFGMREPDVVCRWGGEELVIVLPNTPLLGGQRAAERLRERIAALQIPLPEGTLSVTASIGVAELRDEDSFDSLIERADRAMYEAKSLGRNRVVLEPTREVAVNGEAAGFKGREPRPTLVTTTGTSAQSTSNDLSRGAS